MTPQEIFDKVAAHLLRQGRKSQSTDEWSTYCLYRGPDGTKCAVGCLISDEAYKPYLERKGADEQPVLDALAASGIVDPDKTFLRDLQILHDQFSPKEWEENLSDFAIRHGLQFTAPTSGA